MARITSIFVTSLAILSANILGVLSQSAASAPNLVAGTWNLGSLTLTFSNGTTIQPAGQSPNGRLIFTSNLLYTTQFNRADFAKNTDPEPDRLFEAGTADYNAAVVASVVAASGKYTVDAKGNFVNLTTTGASVPSAIGAQRGGNSGSFVVSADGQSMNETLVLGTNQTYRYQWHRIN